MIGTRRPPAAGPAGGHTGVGPSCARARRRIRPRGGLRSTPSATSFSARVDPVDFHVYLDAAEEIARGREPVSVVRVPAALRARRAAVHVLSVAVADFAVKALLILGVLAVLAIAPASATGAATRWRCSGRRSTRPCRPATSRSHSRSPQHSCGVSATARLAGVGLGASVAAKFVLWPLWVWLAAARRYGAATWSIVAGAVASRCQLGDRRLRRALRLSDAPPPVEPGHRGRGVHARHVRPGPRRRRGAREAS